ncbi:MAG: ferrochelatase [Deltaproteobacteria bacterium RBG_13_47_9]|nr:MAG: ferrochelatase [Deltaproteobacteria bacterium RBG_13_47_9]
MKALLLLAFGGPRSLDEVEFLLNRLFGNRIPSVEQIKRVKERYRLIGGASPLFEITQKQAKALEKKLNARGGSFKSYIGMRYSQPLIEETIKKILRDGINEIVALPMAPFQSRASTGAYIEEVKRVKENLAQEIAISFVVGWHLHPLFLESIRERIREGLKEFNPEERKGVHLLFTAHSLPKSIIEKDPYAKEIEASIKGALEGIDPFPWHMAYQSKGGGPEEWVGPDAESVLRDLSEDNVRDVLIVPIGFVSDHIEILYDIDILYRKKAESLGMVLRRAPSLNFSERFIEALTSVVEEHMQGIKDAKGLGV